MQNHRNVLTVLVATGALVAALAVYAAAGEKKSDEPAMTAAPAPPPRGGMYGKLEKAKAELGLDDAQARKLMAIMRNHSKSMKPLQDQMKELRVAIEEALAADAPDDKRIGELLKTFEMNRKAAEAERWLLFESLDEILTPTQKAKFLIMVLKGMGLKPPKGAKL